MHITMLQPSLGDPHGQRPTGVNGSSKKAQMTLLLVVLAFLYWDEYMIILISSDLPLTVRLN